MAKNARTATGERSLPLPGFLVSDPGGEFRRGLWSLVREDGYSPGGSLILELGCESGEIRSPFYLPSRNSPRGYDAASLPVFFVMSEATGRIPSFQVFTYPLGAKHCLVVLRPEEPLEAASSYRVVFRRSGAPVYFPFVPLSHRERAAASRDIVSSLRRFVSLSPEEIRFGFRFSVASYESLLSPLYYLGRLQEEGVPERFTTVRAELPGPYDTQLVLKGSFPMADVCVKDTNCEIRLDESGVPALPGGLREIPFRILIPGTARSRARSILFVRLSRLSEEKDLASLAEETGSIVAYLPVDSGEGELSGGSPRDTLESIRMRANRIAVTFGYERRFANLLKRNLAGILHSLDRRPLLATPFQLVGYATDSRHAPLSFALNPEVDRWIQITGEDVWESPLALKSPVSGSRTKRRELLLRSLLLQEYGRILLDGVTYDTYLPLMRSGRLAAGSLRRPLLILQDGEEHSMRIRRFMP